MQQAYRNSLHAAVCVQQCTRELVLMSACDGGWLCWASNTGVSL